MVDNQFQDLLCFSHATRYPGLPLCEITTAFFSFHLIDFVAHCLNCQETPQETPRALFPVVIRLQVNVTHTHSFPPPVLSLKLRAPCRCHSLFSVVKANIRRLWVPVCFCVNVPSEWHHTDGKRTVECVLQDVDVPPAHKSNKPQTVSSKLGRQDPLAVQRYEKRKCVYWFRAERSAPDVVIGFSACLLWRAFLCCLN